MARKTYTEEDRARVRQALLDTGLNMAVSKGLKGLHLAELAAAVGISKPYFYTFFDSLEDFSLQMMEEQRCRLLRLLEQELARPEGTWEEHVESFFRFLSIFLFFFSDLFTGFHDHKVLQELPALRYASF